MASGAKLEKSFEDYFRIPILLKGLGNTSQETLNEISTIFNQIDRFPITDDYLSAESEEFSISKDKIKKNQQLYERLKTDMNNRNNYESHKLLFLSEDFENDWSELEIVYRVSFVILVFSTEEMQKTEENGPYRGSDTSVSSVGDLNEKINKINMRLKEKDKQLLGIIFLNDSMEYSKSLTSGIKFTIVPGSLPLEQLSMFIEPWIMDLIPLIEKNLFEHILECKWEENSIIVFNRSEEKSEPKIMKKKKKFRCLKICGDLCLMLHLYRFAYEVYHEAEEQLRKVDDWMWVLGCIQGKLACMTCNAELHIKEEDMDKEIEQLIEESMVISKKIKQQSFEVENTFKILKLLLHEDKERFDDMIENTLATSKGLTEEEKFLYYSYIGSLYSKAKMERKRNYYFFKASLIIEKFKPEVSELLLKTIKQSKYIKEWEELNSKLIHKIIQNESYFNTDAEFHLELLQNCKNVLNPQEMQNIHDYLNYGRFEQRIIETNQEKLIELKEFYIAESPIKPKPNRLVMDESPQKPNKTGVFVGWKKKLTFLYEEDEPIQFKGTILNNLPFEIRLNVFIELIDFPEKIPEFSLILPPSYPYKFTKDIRFTHFDQPITIKKIRFEMWNFELYKAIEPEIYFELYEKQPQFELEVEGAEKNSLEVDRFQLEMEESSYLSLRCILRKMNSIESAVLRFTCSVYYDIDVGFQENQFIFSLENNFNNVKMLAEASIPNIKFLESEEKEPSLYFDQNSNILVMKLKKFKASRDHLKKVEINLDYIREKTSKYQFNKQYILEPKFVNSVWAEVVEISTPELQNSMENMKSLSLTEIEQFRKNWNTIEDEFLVKIRFLKDKFNLKPFKVWYDLEDKESNGKVLGINETILSNLTDGEMWIKLNKIKVCSKEKKRILTSEPENINNFENLKKNLKFRWENIVNKNMEGLINLEISQNPLIYTPKLHFEVEIKKEHEENMPACRTYKLMYTIKSEEGEEIKSHKVIIKAQSETQLGPEINQSSEINQVESAMVESSVNNNANILVKGKTKVNKIVKNKFSREPFKETQEELKSERMFENSFSNSLTLKAIKEKLHDSFKNEKDFEMSIVVSIEFDDKEIGKWQQVVELI